MKVLLKNNEELLAASHIQMKPDVALNEISKAKAKDIGPDRYLALAMGTKTPSGDSDPMKVIIAQVSKIVPSKSDWLTRPSCMSSTRQVSRRATVS